MLTLFDRKLLDQAVEAFAGASFAISSHWLVNCSAFIALRMTANA